MRGYPHCDRVVDEEFQVAARADEEFQVAARAEAVFQGGLPHEECPGDLPLQV